MIKFREKIFFVQLAGAVAGIASLPMMAMQMAQGSEQAEMAEKQNAENIKAMNSQTAAINRLAKANPGMGTQIGQIKAGRFSDTKEVGRRKLFAAAGGMGVVSKSWQTAKNLWKENPKIAEQVKMGVGIGATLGAGKYIVGKMISNDAKNSGIDLNAATQMNKDMQQKAYSADVVNQVAQQGAENTTQKTAGSILSKAKKFAGGQLLNVGFAGMDGVSNWGTWKAEKEALQGMARQTNSFQRQKAYSILQKEFGVGTFFARAAKKTTNGLGSFLGVGNSKTMANVGKKLSKTAGENNIQKTVGDFMTNHKYASTALGVGAGIGVAFPLGEKIGSTAVEVPTKAMDKSAYDWDNYQNSKVQS